MTLDWSFQHDKVRNLAIERTTQLGRSFATPTQKRHIMNTNIIPAIAYGFPVTPYTPPDLKILDTIILKAAKQAHNLINGTPSAILHEDIDKGGVGYTSISTEYVSRNVNSLKQSLNTPGRISTLTQALLHLQLQRLGNFHGTKCRPAHYCMRARQYAMAVSLKQHNAIDTLANITLPSPLHLSLSKLDPTNPEHPMFNKANSLTLPILELPITTLKDLLEPPAPGQPPHQHYIIDGHTLHKKFKNITPSHIQALNNLATLLNSSHHDPGDPSIAKPHNRHKPKEERLIHADNTHLLTTFATTETPKASDIITRYHALHPDQRPITNFFHPQPPQPAPSPPTTHHPNTSTKPIHITDLPSTYTSYFGQPHPGPPIPTRPTTTTTQREEKKTLCTPLPNQRKNPNTLTPTTHLQPLPLHPPPLETGPGRCTIQTPLSLPLPHHGSSHHYGDLHRPCQQSHKHHRMDDGQKPTPQE
jgi:hypothetical protein